MEYISIAMSSLYGYVYANDYQISIFPLSYVLYSLLSIS